MTEKTQPITDWHTHTAPRLTVAAYWKDERTGALYVHESLVQQQAPWAEEAHIRPMKTTESFGDAESWVRYVRLYGNPQTTLLSWNAAGFRGVLDYADPKTDEPGRCQWLAVYPFDSTPQWRAWTALANGQPLTQRQAVERLEDLAEDIQKPAAADLMGLLRGLRASVKSQADVELRPDGTSKIQFASDTTVRATPGDRPGAVDLPATITILIPVLKGHLNADGKPVVYGVDVRVRVSVDEGAHLAFRFSIPAAGRALESIYEEHVVAAKTLLGEGYQLLRAAESI